MKNQIPSVNYHFYQPCNMRCKFCFATFYDVVSEVLPPGHLPKADSLALIDRISEAGFQKITFVGGEPMLCSWLDELIERASGNGLTTMVVTNGSLLESYLAKRKFLPDWFALSIDSLTEKTNVTTGRAKGGKKPLIKEEYLNLCDIIKANNINSCLNLNRGTF